jgi:hypothetical protein
LLLTLTLARINDYMSTATIRSVYAAEGASLAPGQKLLDLSIDLSAIVPHDCPPISFYRIAMRERVWLRRLIVTPGTDVEVGAALACFSTVPGEPLDGEPARAARVTIAGIIDQSDWWRRGAP